jgi:hypothetical protein
MIVTPSRTGTICSTDRRQNRIAPLSLAATVPLRYHILFIDC